MNGGCSFSAASTRKRRVVGESVTAKKDFQVCVFVSLPPSTPHAGIFCDFLSRFSLQAPPVEHALGEDVDACNRLINSSISFRETVYSKLSTTLSALRGDYFRTLLQYVTSAHSSSAKDFKSTACRRCSSTISSSSATLAPCTAVYANTAGRWQHFSEHFSEQVLTRMACAVLLPHLLLPFVVFLSRFCQSQHRYRSMTYPVLG